MDGPGCVVFIFPWGPVLVILKLLGRDGTKMISPEYKDTPTDQNASSNLTRERCPLPPSLTSTVKIGNKGGRKRGGGARNKFLPKKTKQQNLHDETIKETDCESFGNIISKTTSSSITRVAFQNIGPQPAGKFDEKAKQGAMSFARGKFDVLLFAEHGLYHRNAGPSQRWNIRIKYYSKGTFSVVGYNKTVKCDNWKQPGGTGITITKNMVTRKDKEGSGFDETGLGRWSWVRIEGKAKELTVFISAYRPCKNRKNLISVWNQQERFFKSKERITSPNVQMIFENNLCKVIQSTMEKGHKVVLGTDTNDDVRKCECSEKLNNIGMKEIIINFHKERVHQQLTTETKPGSQ